MYLHTHISSRRHQNQCFTLKATQYLLIFTTIEYGKVALFMILKHVNCEHHR